VVGSPRCGRPQPPEIQGAAGGAVHDAIGLIWADSFTAVARRRQPGHVFVVEENTGRRNPHAAQGEDLR